VITDQVKANASSVPSVLGGGIYGPLGLLVITQQYATLLEEEFKFLTNPGLFTPSERGTEA